MSKDKYRPSTADFEVTETEGRQFNVPRGVGDAGEGGPVTPPVLDPPPWENPESPDITEQNWYPRNLRVAKQELHYSAEGKMTVNVTFEWDELESADAYFLRLSLVPRLGQ